MAIYRTRVAVPAAGINVNLLAGSKFEFLQQRSSVHLWASQDGTGGPISLDWSLGNVIVGEDLQPNTAATANNIQRNTDGIGSGAGVPPDRIQIRARNPNATNAQNVTILMEINEF